ncbi:hypothetical protein [Mesonia sp. HuA40]|uniref:hypothetical protein n=1 Tax=Mesonia sp. HuA40 TaxID=2602761 RepID=UPI0011C85C93|nr:hypothetical protein [Mesonia sp. HuA40]TXK70948.1 hypothetical protein FT993_10205 [Mesonia sp. HuA40]
MKNKIILMLGFFFVSYNLFSQIDSTKTSFIFNKSIENAVLIDNSSLGNMIFVEKNRKNVNSKILIYHNNKFYQFDNYIDSLKLKENIKFRILRGEELKEFLYNKINTVILTESDYTIHKKQKN